MCKHVLFGAFGLSMVMEAKTGTHPHEAHHSGPWPPAVAAPACWAINLTHPRDTTAYLKRQPNRYDSPPAAHHSGPGPPAVRPLGEALYLSALPCSAGPPPPLPPPPLPAPPPGSATA